MAGEVAKLPVSLSTIGVMIIGAITGICGGLTGYRYFVELKGCGMTRVANASGDFESDESENEEGVDEPTPGGGSLKAFIEIQGALHALKVDISGVDSWPTLSQVLHEACEERDLPDMPENGIMHIVLDLEDQPVPVTASTPLWQLFKARAVRISIERDGST